MTHRFARFLALALLVLAAPAMAQDRPTVLPGNHVLSDILNRQRVDAAILAGQGAAEATGPSARRQAGVRVATTYRPSDEVSARARRQFTEWMSGLAGAKGGRRVAAALSEHDPVRGWAKIVGDDGLRPGDMADAVASYWILNWTMANGGDNTRAEAQAVRRQVRRMMAASPVYGQLGEAERQEVSEVLMLNFLIQHAAYADAMARGDRATIRRLGEAAMARFQNEMGVDLRRLDLTHAGFVPS